MSLVSWRSIAIYVNTLCTSRTTYSPTSLLLPLPCTTIPRMSTWVLTEPDVSLADMLRSTTRRLLMLLKNSKNCLSKGEPNWRSKSKRELLTRLSTGKSQPWMKWPSLPNKSSKISMSSLRTLCPTIPVPNARKKKSGSSRNETSVGRFELQDDLTRNLADEITVLEDEIEHFKTLIAAEEEAFDVVCFL